MSAFFETYVSTGLKEDVLDMLEVISPDDTPAYSGMRKGRASAVHHEWLEIALPTASAVGANNYPEGQSFAFLSGASYQPVETRRHNYCQIFRNTFRVSDTVNAVSKYGRDSEFGLRKAHALRAHKVDIEVALLDNSATGAGSSGATRTMVGLRTLDGLSATANSSSTDASPIDEANLNALMIQMWDQGTQPNRLLCSSFVKRQIAGFLGGGAGRPIVSNNGEKRMTDVVDIYESDFGVLQLIPSRRLNIKSEVLVWDNSMVAIAMLRAPFTRDTPNDGDYESGVVISELTFEYLNANSVGRLRRVQSA